jgi:hypothetical protein
MALVATPDDERARIFVGRQESPLPDFEHIVDEPPRIGQMSLFHAKP